MWRAAGVFVISLLFAFFSAGRAWAAYAMLDNDRVLLMNNDSRPPMVGRISNQGYYDTNTTLGVSYWTHEPQDDNRVTSTRYLLHGTNHVLHAADGTPLWQLIDCRAGYVPSGVSNRNYIPWSSYAQQSIPPEFRGAGFIRYYTNEVNSCVLMRNADNAAVYSPMYGEGIGTIYADVVNSYSDCPCAIALDIATDVTAAAAAEGFTFSTAGSDYGRYEWRQIPMTVLSVENGNIASISEGVEILTLDVTEGGTTHYFRIRTQLNYRGPIRFRIRRTTCDSIRSPDLYGLIALDNIIASYPPMSAELRRYGTDYDESLMGTAVLGCSGDFTQPFLASNGTGVYGRAFVDFYTNSATSAPVTLSNPCMMYRWRYLNQIVGDWMEIPFDQTYIDSGNVTTSNLVTMSEIPLTDGVGDIEYYFTAEIDAPCYSVRDYANDTAVGFGEGWTEKISAVTNRAVLTNPALYAGEMKLPSGGTDYFARIREGESNMEWVELQGSLTVTNKVAGSNEVVRLLTPYGTVPRMTLVGDHSWRYHYHVPTNAIGGKLAFRFVTKEYYTNATDDTKWFIRTNTLKTVDETVPDIPYTATLEASNPNDISVVLDGASTHLKIEYNDEQGTFTLTHASYQDFNQWTGALNGFVLDGGSSSSKVRYDAPFDNTWPVCPEVNPRWCEDFNPTIENMDAFPPNARFPIHDTPKGWTAQNGCFVESVRGAQANLALVLEGRGSGALVCPFPRDELPHGIDSVAFTARISQPVKYEDFATYMDGLSFMNYAISAKITMSQDYETSVHVPTDMSPTTPSVSFVGYYRGNQGCYEFRMTRITDDTLGLALYKWVAANDAPKATLLAYKDYSVNMLVPSSLDQMRQGYWTSAYFLVYTLQDGSVRLEGHLSSTRSVSPIASDLYNVRYSVISYVDENPGMLRKGGSYGIGSTDCRAGFGSICVHDVVTAPTVSSDAVIDLPGTYEGQYKLADEWNYRSDRWEFGSNSRYAPDGCLVAVVPTNQTVQVWVSDAEASGDTWWHSGYECVVNSFSPNRYTVSPKMPGTWKVRLQTGMESDIGVALDDVSVTPWEGENRWGRNGDSVSNYSGDWVYTKGWITNAAENARVCTFQPSRGRAACPMGLRSPYIDQGMSLFSYSYKNADSNCVLLVQIATNMVPCEGTQDVQSLTALAESDASNGYIWTTIATNDFSKMTAPERASGTFTTFISLRQHWVNDPYSGDMILTNVCGLIRVIVDPAVINRVVGASPEQHEAMLDYGKITITEAHCHSEPMIDQKSWSGWNIYSAGWDGAGNAGPYAYLTDYPDGLSLALNFSAREDENTGSAAHGIGLAHPELAAEYAQQNPFVQCAALSNGIGTVSFRARLFDPDAPGGCAVVTLYGGTDPNADQPTTDSVTWHILTNFVVTSSTYQPFEWTSDVVNSPYKSVRLSSAGARWGRCPSGLAEAWEWGGIGPKQEPINRVFIDDVSVAERALPPSFSIELSPESGSPFISEADEGVEKSRINVKLSSAPTEPITVKLAIERVFTWSNCTMPALNATTLDFAKGQKDGYVYFSSLDGPVEFVLSAVVTTETTNANGIRWCDLFQRSELSVFVENTSPRILGEESSDVVRVTMGEPFSVSWMAEDVLADSTNGIVATWMVDGLATTIPMGNVMSTTFGGTQELVFTSAGSKVARLTLRDKDGGEDARNFYFDVQPRPAVITIDVGGDAKSFSVEWIGRMMGLPTEWVTSHQSLAKSLLEALSANGRLSVIECYVLGLDPEKEDEDFKIISFPMNADGTPDLVNLVFAPPQSQWNVPGATPVVKGAASLDGEWQTVTEDNKARFRFFKVVVEVP